MRLLHRLNKESLRELWGGDWYTSATLASWAHRYGRTPDADYEVLGFRLCGEIR